MRLTAASKAGAALGGLDMFMAAFRDWPKEADLIAHLLGGYGELEFMLSVCVGRSMNNLKKGVKVIYRTRGETPRINLADALMSADFRAAGLGDKYADTLGGIRRCLRIRNMLSHCHWATLHKEGLFLTQIGEAAMSGGDDLAYDWRHITLPYLTECDEYFTYTHRCFWHIEAQFQEHHGRPSSTPLNFPMPSKRQPPPEPSPPEPHILAKLPKGI